MDFQHLNSVLTRDQIWQTKLADAGVLRPASDEELAAFRHRVRENGAQEYPVVVANGTFIIYHSVPRLKAASSES